MCLNRLYSTQQLSILHSVSHGDFVNSVLMEIETFYYRTGLSSLNLLGTTPTMLVLYVLLCFILHYCSCMQFETLLFEVCYKSSWITQLVNVKLPIVFSEASQVV